MCLKGNQRSPHHRYSTHQSNRGGGQGACAQEDTRSSSTRGEPHMASSWETSHRTLCSAGRSSQSSVARAHFITGLDVTHDTAECRVAAALHSSVWVCRREAAKGRGVCHTRSAGFRHPVVPHNTKENLLHPSATFSPRAQAHSKRRQETGKKSRNATEH